MPSTKHDDVASLRAENVRLQALVAALQAAPVSPSPLWASCLTLDEARTVVAGSAEALGQAVALGADLRVVTQFHHNEHVDGSSHNNELVLEPSSFPVTIALFDDDNGDGAATAALASPATAASRTPSWCAAVMVARQPVNPNDNTGPGGFNGSGAALSLFMYNQDGQQARAAVQLNREAFTAAAAQCAEAPGGEFAPGDEYPKQLLDGMMEIQGESDVGTNAPSSNFVYQFQGVSALLCPWCASA